MADTNEKSNKEIENFVWDNPSGLRFVSDEMLEACNLIYEKAKLSLKFIDESIPTKDGNQENSLENRIIKVHLSSNINSLCYNNYTIQDLINALNNEECKLPNGKELFVKDNKEFTLTIYNPKRNFPDYQIDSICTGCTFEKCPKLVIAYIKYLHDNNLYEEKISDRATYRANNIVNKYFNFDWKIDHILKEVNDSVFNYSLELVNKGLIQVHPCLERKGTVRISYGQSCSQLSACNLDTEMIDNNNLGVNDYNKWMSISRIIDNPVGFCSVYSCRLDGCPPLVAAAIYYLKKQGKENLITEYRDYYHENQEKQDLIVKEQIDKVFEKQSERLQESFKSIYEYQDRIKSVNELVDILSNRNQKNLHIAITGDIGVGKTELAKKIGKILFNMGKINLKEPRIQRLTHFAYHSAGDEDGISSPKRLFYHSVEYLNNKEKCLYVLTDIDEFINDYRLHMEKSNTGSYSEIKRKQFKHTIELLTNMVKNNYFILLGSQEDVDSFLKLSVKLKYAFQNNIFHLPNMSIEEMLKVYYSLLKPELVTVYRSDEQTYKKKFIDFVSLNEKQLPYSNTELANYLAMYSNTKNAIEFPPDVYNKKTIDESLAGIIGLSQIKKRIKEFEKYMLYRMKAQNLGLSLASSNMHMIFEGNPGTGKTTIARIMAQMLYDMGIVKENKLIEVERKDLVANYMGQTATKTAEVIESAKNGVLFIDEAYELAKGKGSNDFGGEAIATLIKAMEDHKDELVVIFAGYTKEMHDFLNLNPGIASRIGYTFTFEDYNSEELCKIFNLKMKKMGFVLNNIDDEILTICDYYSKRKNFGNGRFVDKLIQETIMKHSQNCNDNINIIEKVDIPTIEELANNSAENKDASEMLNKIVGMKNVKEKIKEFEAYIRFVKEARERKIKIPAQNMHMIFTGNPGTGKTTIARIVAQILFSMGIIHENKLLEVESKDLVAQYVGQTAPKTADVIDRAMGGVLFIDEAYTLAGAKGSSSNFGAEAIATLIKAMEDHKGEFVVIFAGYKNEMRDFVEINPGIASRIGYTFHFEDYSAEELEQIFYIKASSMEMTVSDSAKERIKAIMTYFHSVDNIGNGRFVDRVIQECLVRHSKNVIQNGEITDEKVKTIDGNDVPEVMEMAQLLINGDEMPDLSKITPESLKKTAYHELGHAFVGYKMFDTPGIKILTINPEGAGSLGYVQFDGSNTPLTNSKENFEKKITRLLGGMASEQVFRGHYESGNYSDLETATRIAKGMVCRYGMSDLGLGQIKNPSSGLEYEVQKEINKILDKCFKNAINILENNRAILDNAVNYVLQKKEVTGDELLTLFQNNGMMPVTNVQNNNVPMSNMPSNNMPNFPNSGNSFNYGQ